jgi:hypothetical protein
MDSSTALCVPSAVKGEEIGQYRQSRDYNPGDELDSMDLNPAT